MTKQNTAEIIVVLDRSGSMSSIKDDIEGGLRTFVEEQKANGLDTRFSLYQFDEFYEPVVECKPMSEVGDFKLMPRGSTALWDAIGRTINAVGQRLSNTPEGDRPAKVVLLILTDGAENASKEFGSAKIREMIEHQKSKYQWQVLFMGSNQDAALTGRSIGLSTMDCMSFSNKARGPAMGLGDTSANITGYLRGATVSASYSVDQKTKQDDLIKKYGN